MNDPFHAVLLNWLDAVNAVDVDRIAAMYASDAVLLPTFSNRVRRDAPARRDYFAGLSPCEDLLVEVDTDSLAIQPSGDDTAVLSGLYTWTFVRDGADFRFVARFTYVVKPSAPAPILHHHSSEVPPQ